MAELRPENVRYIIVHDIGVAADQSAAQIDDYHRNVRKYADGIGYHWVVRKNGDVEQGRPENIVGAHTRGKTTIESPNFKSIGIAMTGNLEMGEVPQAQRAALVDKVAQLCIKYNVPVANVQGHGEVEPGNSDLSTAEMNTFRPLVEARIAAIRQEQGAGRTTPPAPTAPAPRPTPTPAASTPAATPQPAAPAATPRPVAPVAAASAGAPTGRAVHPLPTLPAVQPSAAKGQTFGAARGTGAGHNGADYSAPVGTRIGAIDAGTVVAVVRDASRGQRVGAGNYVIVRHDGTGMHSVYEHMQNGSFAVEKGQRVAAGQTLGNVGMTGNTTGPHLHLSVFAGGRDAAFADGRFAKSVTGATTLDPVRVVGQTYTTLPGLRAPQPGATAPGATAPGAAAPRDLLKVGMQGPDVRALQHRLTGLGYGDRVGAIDGVFDAGLATVVKQFQADRGLPANYQTGNAGAITRGEMDAAVRENDRDGRAPAPARAAQPATPKTAGTPAPSGDGSLGAPPVASRATAPGTAAPATPTTPPTPKTVVTPTPPAPSGDGSLGAPPVAPIAAAPGTTAPGTTAPGTTAPGTTAPGATAPGATAPGVTAPPTKTGSADPQMAIASAAFLREADQAVANVLDRHVSDVPGALAALVRDTRGPGSGVLGATTAEDVQRSFDRFTSGDATARPLSATEAGMVARVIDERARIVAEGGVPTPQGDGASTTLTPPSPLMQAPLTPAQAASAQFMTMQLTPEQAASTQFVPMPLTPDQAASTQLTPTRQPAAMGPER